MLTLTRVGAFLAVTAAGGLFWLALLFVAAPGGMGIRSSVTPFICCAMGAYWATTILPIMARARPEGFLANGQALSVKYKLAIFAASFAGAAAYWVMHS